MKKKLMIIAIIWIGWAILTYWTTRDTFDEFLITSRTGVPETAKCEFTRSNTILELSIQHAGESSRNREIVFLPSNIRCDDQLLSRLIGKDVTITDYKNFTLGFAVGDEIIMDIKDNLWKVETNDHFVGMITFVAFITSFFVLIKGPYNRSLRERLSKIRESWNM